MAGIPELVEDGVTGYLTPPGDAETLAARILALTENPDLRHDMGAKGREKVVKEFNIHTEAARIATLYLDGPTGALRPDPLPPEDQA